jgi:hypothetical protein
MLKKSFYLILTVTAILALYSFAIGSGIDGWIKGEECWVTKTPGAEATIVGIIMRKSAVTVTDIGNGWLKIVSAPVINPKNGKFIDCADCYIKKNNFTTLLPGKW